MQCHIADGSQRAPICCQVLQPRLLRLLSHSSKVPRSSSIRTHCLRIQPCLEVHRGPEILQESGKLIQQLCAGRCVSTRSSKVAAQQVQLLARLQQQHTEGEAGAELLLGRVELLLLCWGWLADRCLVLLQQGQVTIKHLEACS